MTSATPLATETLRNGILASYTAQDATMGLVSTAIAAYVTTSLITFANSTVPPTNTGVATTIVMVTPPVFTPSMAAGMGGGSIEDVCDSLATVIDTAYGSILFTGTATVGSAVTVYPPPGVPIL